MSRSWLRQMMLTKQLLTHWLLQLLLSWLRLLPACWLLMRCRMRL
jgi:hypothetical protein